MSLPVLDDVAAPTEVSGPRWTGTRIARLGMLIGLGWDAKRVADDPIIASTANNVCRQAGRFCLSFKAGAAMALNLPPNAARCFDKAAARRGLTREALLRALLIEIAREPNLIANIIDDGMDDQND